MFCYFLVSDTETRKWFSDYYKIRKHYYNNMLHSRQNKDENANEEDMVTWHDFDLSHVVGRVSKGCQKPERFDGMVPFSHLDLVYHVPPIPSP